MVKVNTDVMGNPLPCSIYLDGREKKVLEMLHKRTINKWDSVIAIVGNEGDGKTTYGLTRALFLDSTLNIDRCAFGSEEFYKIVDDDKLPKYSCVVWDESDDISGHWASSISFALKSKFKRIRKKRLKIFLITPTFFDFNKYFAIFRTKLLIHIHAKGFTRGFFRLFDMKSKKILYLEGKEKWNMYSTFPRLSGRFTDFPVGFPIDMSEDGEYENKKDEATKNLGKKSVNKYEDRFNKLLAHLLENKVLTQAKIGSIVGLKRGTISHMAVDVKENVDLLRGGD